MLRAYPHEPTVEAGGTLLLHVATDAQRYVVRLERWADGVQIVHESGPFPGEHAPPGRVDAPWNWPELKLRLPGGLAPGAYVARFITDGGAAARGAPRDDSPDARWGTALFVVRGRSDARVLVNLPLFTYHAYNVAQVDTARRVETGESLFGGAAAVTLHRPGGGTGGHLGDELQADAYDRTTPRQTFAHWDLYALAWLAKERIAVDVCTDLDLQRGEVELERYALLCGFGHDRYWTREKRGRYERFLEGGGNVAFFGGHTCALRARYDDTARTLSCEGSWDDDPHEALTGLSHRAGGIKWGGQRPPTGYRILQGTDPVLRDAHVTVNDLIAPGAYVVGYACDGVDPARAPGNLRVLGRTPLEGWKVTDGSGEIGADGHAAMAVFERGAGTVFNAGTTDWARALGWGDARVKAITRSVVRRLTERPA